MFPRASIRARLLASLLSVAVVAAAGLSFYFLRELEAFALRKLEERLGAEAQVVAALLGSAYEESGTVPKGLPSTSGDAAAGRGETASRRAIASALQGIAPTIASRIRVIDVRGNVIADSHPRPVSTEDYRGRREVKTALGGSYGAQTRVLQDSRRVALYVAVPIRAHGDVVGAAYASSTTFSIVTLLHDYRERLAFMVLAFGVAMLLLTEVFTRWLAGPLAELAATAAALAGGDHSVRVTPRGSRETRELAEAFNRMASEVDSVVTEMRSEERRKSRFVSDVSHELRTPLTAIRGAAETLLDDEMPAEDRRRFLRTIMLESDRLARLANDLLTLQRIEGATGELPLRQVDLADIVRRAVAGLEPLLEARGVHVEVSGEGGAALGDPDRLQQVVANLVDNASRVSPEGSCVRIELARDGGTLSVSVIDEGPGIPADALPHLFERFFRAQASRDRSSGGAGLGLAIVKAIVVAHAGSVEAANEPEGGSRFTVRLPALDWGTTAQGA